MRVRVRVRVRARARARANAVGKTCKLTDSEAEDEDAEIASASKGAGESESVDVENDRVRGSSREALQVEQMMLEEEEGHKMSRESVQASSIWPSTSTHPDISLYLPKSLAAEEASAGQRSTVMQKNSNPFLIRTGSPIAWGRSDISDSVLEKQLALLQEVREIAGREDL